MSSTKAFKLSPQQRCLFAGLAGRSPERLRSIVIVRVDGAFAADRFRASLVAAIDRLEICRTTFRKVPSSRLPVQVVEPMGDGALMLLTDNPGPGNAADRGSLASARRALEAVPLYDDPGPRVAAYVARLADDRHLVGLAMAAACADATTVQVLLREALMGGEPAGGAGGAEDDAPVQYAALADVLNELLRDPEAIATREAVTRALLAACDQADVPSALAAGVPMYSADSADASSDSSADSSATSGSHPARLRFELATEVVGALRAHVAPEPRACEAAVLAAWALVLGRLLESHAPIVGVGCDGAESPELAGMLGPLTRHVPMSIELQGSMAVSELVSRIARVRQQGEEAQYYVDWADVSPAMQSRGLPYLFDSCTASAVLSGTRAGATWTASLLDRIGIGEGGGLGLVFNEQPGGAWFDLWWDAGRYGAATVETIGRRVCWVLTQMACAWDAPISRLGVVTDDERAHMPGVHATRREWPDEPWVHEAIANVARVRPEAIAVRDGDRTWSYDELNRRANRLAHVLRARGVGWDDRVAICMERSAELVAAVLAVLKAGAAYVPVDPAYPPARVSFLLRDAGARLIVTHEAAREVVHAARGGEDTPEAAGEGPARIVTLEAIGDELAAASDRDPDVRVAGDHAAYVIYTSGSTGQPKGAVNTHAAARNHMLWMREAYGFAPADAALQKTPFSFDASVWEFFVPLMAGGTVVVCRPGGHGDPAYLIDTIQRAGVTVIQVVPSLLTALLTSDGVSACTTLRAVFCGGEALRADAVRQCRTRLPGATLHNLYGPTEAAIDATSWTCPAEWDGPQVPIGRPIANMRTYVLDTGGMLAPRGVAGELYLGGISLARGYLGRPGLTATRFVPDAWSGEPGARLYRTGDRVRWNAAGELEYLGRLDHQIKLRGHRIELGEVEAALTALDDVRQSAVVLREDVAGTPQLVAYIVRDGAAPARDAEAAGGDAGGEVGADAGVGAARDVTPESWIETVRARLASRLPTFMVPAVMVPLAALPLTPNGKVDRRALPAPPAPSCDAAPVMPTTPQEAQLAAIWARVLKQPAVSIDANFFALGGDSILSIQVVARAAQAGLRLTPRQVFEYPTVRRLAAVAQSIAPATADRAGASFALTPIQAAFVATPRVARDYYNQAVLLTVAPGVSGPRLRRALHALEAQHGLLRARFVQDAAGWRGVIAPVAASPMSVRAGEVSPVVAGSRAPAARTPGDALCVVALECVSSTAVGRVQTRVCAQWQRSLCLATGPVWRAGLMTRADGERRLLLAAHHLIVDGVSWRILLEDLQQALAQAQRGLAITLAPPNSSFAQWSDAVRTAATQWPVAAEQAWWRAAAAAPVAPLPCDAPLIEAAARSAADPSDGDEPSAASTVDARRAANRVGTVRTVTVSLSAAATTRLVRRTAQATGSGTEAILLTAVVGAIGRWSRASSVRVALEGHGREELPGVDVSRTVGWFTTIYPVTLPATGAPAARLQAVTEHLAAVPRRGFGYGLLRTHAADPAVRAERLADDAPEISVNYLGQFDAVWDDAALLQPAAESTGPTQRPDEHRPYAIEIVAAVHDGCLRVRWMYSAAWHTRATIDMLAQDCLRQLESLLDDGAVLPAAVLPIAAHADGELAAADIAHAVAQVQFG